MISPHQSRHDIALAYAKKAVESMEEAYDHTLHSYSDPKERRQFVQIVATAHHNAAVEYEYVGYLDQSVTYYQKAFSVALQNLGSEHPLTKTFEKSLVEARRKQ